MFAGPGPAVPGTPAPAPVAEPLRTEFDFELPRGYVDGSGTVHKRGSMRLSTARDELIPLRDVRVRENPPFLSVVLLGRVITRLGTLPEVNDAFAILLGISHGGYLARKAAPKGADIAPRKRPIPRA